MHKIKDKRSFPGGIHPLEGKELTENKQIRSVPLPDTVTLLLTQHIGGQCQPLVNKNDQVTQGQLIAKSNAFVSAPVHSPVNGKVKEISLQPHPVLGRCPGIVIEVDKENTPEKQFPFNLPDNFNVDNYSPQQITEAVSAAGIVGMGGAGFPTHVKIAPDPAGKKHTLIINGCECEPFITCDYRIMLEWTKQIIAGVKLAAKAAGTKKTYIGIEDNKPQALQVFADVLKDDNTGIEIVPLKTKYPQGGERQLIKAITGTFVPTGGIPPMIGMVVLNVATAAAIADAVINNHPLTHRVVTVTGKTIKDPSNLYVPLGTPVEYLIDQCGGVTEKSPKVVLGGPMMGIAVADITTPVIKTTGSILILTEQVIGKAKHRQQQTACIRCGRCLEVCPENLNPTKIAHAVKYKNFDLAKSYFINACIECGCCSYICPANLEITGMIKTGKLHLAREKKKMPK